MEHTIIKPEVIMRDDQTVASYAPINENIFSLKGQTAVVTGAGQGMGLAIATGLAKFGANIAAVDVNADSAEKVAQSIRALGVEAEGYAVNIGDKSAVDALMEKVQICFGHIDILVNNAGVGSASDFPNVDAQTWLKVMKVNLDGTFYCTQAACKYMAAQKHGSIISIGSSLSSRAAVLNCLGGSPEYCVSKSGVQTLMRSVAQFMAKDGIRANAVAPGPVDSPMHANRREALASELPRVPLGRIQNCDDVVGSIIFLASEASRFITGQTIHVNGGMLMVD